MRLGLAGQAAVLALAGSAAGLLANAVRAGGLHADVEFGSGLQDQGYGAQRGSGSRNLGEAALQQSMIVVAGQRRKAE